MLGLGNIIRRPSGQFIHPVHNTETMDLPEVQFPRLLAAISGLLSKKQVSALAGELGISGRDVSLLLAKAAVEWENILDATDEIGYSGVSMSRDVQLKDQELDCGDPEDREAYNMSLMNAGAFIDQCRATVALDCTIGQASMSVYKIDDKAAVTGLTTHGFAIGGRPVIEVATPQDTFVEVSTIEGDGELIVNGRCLGFEIIDGLFVARFAIGEKNSPIDEEGHSASD